MFHTTLNQWGFYFIKGQNVLPNLIGTGHVQIVAAQVQCVLNHPSFVEIVCVLPSQVSHHPPAAAHHVISDRGWTLRQEITVASKFRGKYLSIMPLGEIC